MADGAPNSMNFDLNLGPVENPSGEPGSLNLEDWLDGPITEAIGQRSRSRQRWRSVWRPVPIAIENTNIALELIGGNGTETGEGSVAAEERGNETKICENDNGVLEDKGDKEKDDVEKVDTDEGSFFDCNICLDLASDPVVTCCGHLFCWPCLYKWLNVHSDAKECPICKGEVTTKSVTPIYGRGNKTRQIELDSSLKIPHRPIARRVESWRQTIHRNGLNIPMEEMIRRLGNRFDLSRDVVDLQSATPDTPRELPERSNTMSLNRFLSSRGIRREQNNTSTPGALDNIEVHIIPDSPTNSEQVERESLRLSSLLSRRSNRAAAISSLTSALSSAERLVENYFRNQSDERHQEQPPVVDDRDSVSSIAAVIQSESQTLDNAVEIESTTSSSRRRRQPSRTSDVDSGDSLRPSTRRRRLR